MLSSIRPMPTMSLKLSPVPRDLVAAVNGKGGFGRWCCEVVYKMAKMRDVLTAHAE